MILLNTTIQENPHMTSEQIASLQPALTKLLEMFRACFARDKTFKYLEKYILGLLSDLKRKSIEPIALAAGIAVRTLQEFLAFFKWDHEHADKVLMQQVAARKGNGQAVHSKQGPKTPGVRRQWCGETGKVDNCVVGQHLLYVETDPVNPFACVVASDLFLPEEWADDWDRRREAGIPDDLTHRPKWAIGLDQIRRAISQGIRFAFITADEDYGKVPQFWSEIDRLGQWAVAEVPKNFRCWPKRPTYRSARAEYAAKRVDDVISHSPAFYTQRWQTVTIKDTTRGVMVWQAKAAQVYLVDTEKADAKGHSRPTDRTYWLIAARNKQTGEWKYFVSNAPANVPLKRLLEVGFARWHIEKWFERAKQETGFGAFEVRTYTSLLRHWLASRIAMFFLATETERLRGEKSADHVGAGSRCGQCSGLDDMGVLAPFAAQVDPDVPVLSISE